jgi:DNA adenine methylase
MKRVRTKSENSQEANSLPKPFLRWAGGKRRLTELLIDSIPKRFDPVTGKYFEPFIGGGAMMFALGDKHSDSFVKGNNVFINDSNPDLIATYKVIKLELDELIRKLHSLARDTSKEAYDRIRKTKPRDEVSRAARFIYLNKTCFNGLWRVNSKGEFNVPWGKLKDPVIFNTKNLAACSLRLRGAKISCGDFELAVRKAQKGDLVYFDPPYLPLSASSSFSKYAKDDFTFKDHEKLAKVILDLTKRGVFVLLSNSDTPESRELFGTIMNLRQIPMNRSISASSSSRKPVMELLGTNFLVEPDSLLSKFKQVKENRGNLK